ncbi:hypothetical protein [Marivita sp. S2033]|uniref:hypothetical protein n=1 Tax=Marivita sp. S2033 TaxID=3373187 RepID=UPI003981B172
MSRKFIGVVLAISTTIAGIGAAPANAASNEDVARILGAAATVFIIGKAIENARDDDRDKKKKKAKHYDRTPHVIHRDRHIPKVVPRSRNRAAALPRQCVRQIEGGRVNRVVMAPCLKRNYRSARALPKRCQMAVETRRGTQRAYALPCLRDRGYTVARR